MDALGQRHKPRIGRILDWLSVRTALVVASLPVRLEPPSTSPVHSSENDTVAGSWPYTDKPGDTLGAF
jgi:hypothetical protein